MCPRTHCAVLDSVSEDLPSRAPFLCREEKKRNAGHVQAGATAHTEVTQRHGSSGKDRSAVRYHVMPAGWLESRPMVTGAGQGVQRGEPLRPAGGDVAWCGCSGKQSGGVLKKLNTALPVVWGVWVAQLVEYPTSAQVVISRFMSSRPGSGSPLSACRHRAGFRSSVPLSHCPSPACALSLRKKKKKLPVSQQFHSRV